jgi:predicted transposase/invertase (TIGR01784 family)
MTSMPHDALVKAVFTDLENARGQLQALLPPALVEQLDWSTLRVEPGSFVDEALKERHSDILYSVRFRADPQVTAFLYLLFEHQSGPDHWMPFRLLRYDVRIWEDFLKAHPDAKHLPVIVPMVLHHGPDGWTTSKRMFDLFDVQEPIRSIVAPYLPDFGFVLDDLASKSDEELRGRAMTAFARLALWFLRDARQGTLLEHWKAWATVFSELLAHPTGLKALELLLRYFSYVAAAPGPEKLRHTLLRELGPKAEEAYMTHVEIWKAEGEAKGRTEGEAKGVLTVLRARGLTVDDAIRDRVLACRDLPTLERWLVRAATATSVDDVFAADPS